MKLKIFFILLWLSPTAYCQMKTLHFYENKNLISLNKEEASKIIQYDFSDVWIHTDNSHIFGSIGDNHQRIRIKMITITKDTAIADIYHVVGKSMVKSNICDFSGILHVSYIRRYKYVSNGVDDQYKNKVKSQYKLTGYYVFNEEKTQKHTGVFKGVFQSDIYLDSGGKVHYDDIDLQADGFDNNQFLGKWTSYDGKITKICNWGDYRIPNAGSFDQGAGDFEPNTNDVSLGWQSYIDQFKSAKAKKEEQRMWWN